MKIKEYNQWELRVLSILVPKYTWIGLVAYSNNCKMDRALFAGSYPNGNAPKEGGGLFFKQGRRGGGDVHIID